MPVEDTNNLERRRESNFTLRNPPYSYLHVKVADNHGQHTRTTSSQTAMLDEVTLRSLFVSALQQYLGLTGAAIPIDILKVEPSRNEAWLRLPFGDEPAVVAALSQWVSHSNASSIRILARGSWLGGLVESSATDNDLWALESGLRR